MRSEMGLTLGNSKYSTELKTGRKYAGHLTAVRRSPGGPACHRTTRFFSEFTSDDARVLTGRVSHKKFGSSENSEFCSRAEVGPFQRLIHGKLAAPVGAEGAPTGAVIGAGPALACEERKQKLHFRTRHLVRLPTVPLTAALSTVARHVRRQRLFLARPSRMELALLHPSHQTARAVCFPRLCSLRLRLLIGQ